MPEHIKNKIEKIATFSSLLRSPVDIVLQELTQKFGHHWYHLNVGKVFQ